MNDSQQRGQNNPDYSKLREAIHEFAFLLAVEANSPDPVAAAVDDASLVFPNRRFMVLLGSSGSGKSTLLYLIASIYKPTSGEYSSAT